MLFVTLYNGKNIIQLSTSTSNYLAMIKIELRIYYVYVSASKLTRPELQALRRRLSHLLIFIILNDKILFTHEI